ncbi:hypothetical protein MAM1_0066c04001 [Mucor ambiguus]|uniref:Ricin B lectin domain-containing protein n=1 Tax=Mucor ambiguus TaxID=91626 RepID=A0A0C9LU76_9FUNG|nr:hypothetical protein MAM1_0066c04001 [Mucor ambiguus]
MILCVLQAPLPPFVVLYRKWPLTVDKMSDFPSGWFYIECLNRQGQVLTVSDMSMQPSVRVELRPKKIGGHPHQLWCYHQGFLVNKHSGCVLGVEKDKIKDQCVFQSKRLDRGEKKQTWHYDNSKLVLRHEAIGYALNDLQVPKMTIEDEGCAYLLSTPY